MARRHAANHAELSRDTRGPGEAATHVIRTCSIASAIAAMRPFPAVDLARVTPIQVGMVRSIARIYGYPLVLRDARKLIGAIGMSVVVQDMVIAAVKLVPVAGVPVAISGAYALTYAIGEAAKAYFEHGRTLSIRRLRAVFRRAYHRQRGAIGRAAAQNERLITELRRLAKLYSAGQIGEAEYVRRKQELTSGLA
ncbi:MAG TPA: DUF697 domain-containing protein [Kofleriaceae bacterium]